VATAGELKALGFTDNGIRRLIRRGELVVQRKGVYAPAGFAAKVTSDSARTHALCAAAALAGTNAECAASHWSAAIIHGLDLLGLVPADVVSLTQAPGRTGSRGSRPGVFLHVADLPVNEMVRRYGVPVTSVARTVVDLARTGTFREGVVVADSALHAGKTTLTHLHSVVAACRHWPRIARARQVLTFCDARSESVLESLARVIMHEQGLPPAELQAWVADAFGARIGRVDFFWPQYRTIGEADGEMTCEQPAQARRQLERDATLRRAGYELVHFGWRGIVHDAVEVTGDLRAAFRRGQT
jgi:hypothetical protein